MVSPTDQTFATASEQKIIPKNIDNRYHGLNPSTTKETTMIDEESTDPTWATSGTLTFLDFIVYFFNI